MKICFKCNNQFPKSIIIEGKYRNLQNRKYCFECSPFGLNNTKNLHIDNSKKVKRRTKYNWKDIQIFYDSGKSYRDLQKEYGMSSASITKAVNRGDLVTRSISEALKISNKNNPRKHTEESREKISQGRRKYLLDNPDKVPYKLNHYSHGESYPEKYFREWLEKENIDFIAEYRISYYSIDFFINNLALEIDGEQHYVDERIVKSNKIRDDYLKSLNIQTIRVRWKYYKQLKSDDRINFLKDLKELLSNDSNEHILEVLK